MTQKCQQCGRLYRLRGGRYAKFLNDPYGSMYCQACINQFRLAGVYPKCKNCGVELRGQREFCGFICKRDYQVKVVVMQARGGKQEQFEEDDSEDEEEDVFDD